MTSSLARDLSAAELDPNQLMVDFSEWKDHDPDEHYLFGKDGFNAGSNNLRHVHIVPLFVATDQEKWDHAWESRHGRRTSDRYLFYADGGKREGFLLIDILDDPGAHTIWMPAYRGTRQFWEDIAEQFIVFGTVP